LAGWSRSQQLTPPQTDTATLFVPVEDRAGGGDRLDRLEKQLETLLKEVKGLKGTQTPQASQSHTATQVTDAKPEQKQSAAGSKVPVTYQAVISAAQPTTTYVRSTSVSDPGSTVLLSRSTYKMPRDRADALAAFLKDQVKSPTIETKVEEEGIVVTTTPEAQQVIGQFIHLTQGKGMQGQTLRYESRQALPK
jgi:hypothetical protein